jgi:hypothetical protein
VCLRVTEPADGDLILGRGKAKQGYRPDLLDSPGKLLAWDPPDHTRPIPAKAYTLDRARIRQLAATPGAVPDLDADSAAALAAPAVPNQAPPQRRTAAGPRTAPAHPERSQTQADPRTVTEAAGDGPAGDGDPLAALWAALQAAGPRGAKVAELAHTVGRAKTWVYERLQDLHRQGHVERAGHGRWRLIHDPDGEDAGAPSDHVE